MKWLALTLTLGFIALHLVGARAHVGLLSGTRVGSDAHVLLAVAYVLAWLGVCIVAPILVIATVLLALVRARGTIAARVGSWRSSRAH